MSVSIGGGDDAVRSSDRVISANVLGIRVGDIGGMAGWKVAGGTSDDSEYHEDEDSDVHRGY